MKELELIDYIKSCNFPHKNTLGLRDDTALIKGNSDILVTTDMLLDQVHFDSENHDSAKIGYKALSVNISDIAAMGGWPTSAFLSLALPKKSKHKEFIVGFLRGIKKSATPFGVALDGGDTNYWDGPLVVNVTLLGTPHKNGIAKRSGAKLNDRIFVTGKLGGSLKGRHLSFQPRVEVSKILMDNYIINAMIDISDGLATDLGHILTQSQVGAILFESQIPIHLDLIEEPNEKKLLKAMTDGEDFELCFTCSPDTANKISLEKKVPVFEIGKIVNSPEVIRVDCEGIQKVWTKKGYQHG